jgi:hypothetical protein
MLAFNLSRRVLAMYTLPASLVGRGARFFVSRMIQPYAAARITSCHLSHTSNVGSASASAFVDNRATLNAVDPAQR